MRYRASNLRRTQLDPFRVAVACLVCTLLALAILATLLTVFGL